MQQTKNDIGIQWRRKIKSLLFGACNFFRHYCRSVRNINANYYASEENFLPILTANYHAIEKSLAMSKFEPGHAKERVAVVCGDILQYKSLGFDTTNVQFVGALQAVDAYRRIHQKIGYDLGTMLNATIEAALGAASFEPCDQPYVTSEQFFADVVDYGAFAKSRHSVRAFSDREIPRKIIENCIDIARTTPTACNRQPNTTYVVTDAATIGRIASLQGGGRGFAEKANAILVVTSRVSCFSYNEIMEAFKSGGMYTMNLLLALHSFRIGACTLEWNERRREDNKLRRMLLIPDNEEIVMLVAAGYPPDEFSYVASMRNPLEKSCKFV